MKTWQTATLALAVVLLLAIVIGAGQTAPVDAASAKIDPRVRAATTNGGTAPVLIILSEQADLSGAARLATKEEKGRFVLSALMATAQRTQHVVEASVDRLGYTYQPYYIVNLLAVENATLAGLEQLAARRDVARIESNAGVHLALPQPARELESTISMVYGIPWGIRKINAPYVWSMGYTGKGIVYANADTGIAWRHPALINHYRGYANGVVNHNYNWWDAVHKDVNGNGSNPCGFSVRHPCDDYGHGTHTLGTGIGRDSIGNKIGVAPGARWIACRNMEEGWGTPAQYIECFQFFLAPWDRLGNNPNPNLNADVISNSWTCPPSEGCAVDTLAAAVQAERAAGIFVVASAGNSGSAGCGSISDPPAIYDSALTVGATDNYDHLAWFSGLGPITVDGSNRLKPDLAAPGVNVLSSVPGGGYAKMSGTSMATPHVAGAVALLWQAKPSLRGQVGATEQILFQSAYKSVMAIGSCGGTSSLNIPNDLFGYGRLNAYKAVVNALR